MYFRQFSDSRTAAISYLLADPSSAEAVAIDPDADPCQALVLKSLLSVSYLWRDRLFCGDALELGGCGLSEDRECDPGHIYDSVTARLFTLPDEVLVFPGHDFQGRTVSTIGEERQRNPLFLARSRDAFVTAFRDRQQRRLDGLFNKPMALPRS